MTLPGPTPPRIELAERVAELVSADMTQAEAAAELGISRAYVGELVVDPTGERARARKRSYGGNCEDCGRRTDGSNGRANAPRFCHVCSPRRQRDERRWTRAAVIDAIRRFAAEHGRPPTSAEWHARGQRPSDYPVTGTVVREFGKWADAVEAAGYPRPQTGHYGVAKTLNCEECGGAFTSARGARCCSPRCRDRWRWTAIALARPGRERHCGECGAAFTTRPVQGQGRRKRCYDCSPPATVPA